MKPVITGRKRFVVAIFITSILLITLYETLRGDGSSSIIAASEASWQASVSKDMLPARGKVRFASFSMHQANHTQAATLVVDTSMAPGSSPVAAQTATPQPDLPSLTDFVAQVANGEAERLVGIYVKDIMALLVVQQPDGDPAYIDTTEGTATQFFKASLYGATGLLAHNYLSGRYFFDLIPGTDLVLVYGNGRISHYTVSEIGDYQRLTPADLRSDFLDLATRQQESVDGVFAHYYQQKQVLTLQTCIARDGNSDWGVRFIMAQPAQVFIDIKEVASRVRR